MQQQAEAWGGESLDAVMSPAKSRVQVEKEEWEARRAAEVADAVRDGAPASHGEPALAAAAPAGVYRCSSPRSSAASEGACDEGGIEAAAGAEAQPQPGDVDPSVAEAGEPALGEDELADEFGGMSLEELEAALAAAEADAAAALAAAEAGNGGGYVTSAAGFAGLSLADLQKRKSRWAATNGGPALGLIACGAGFQKQTEPEPQTRPAAACPPCPLRLCRSMGQRLWMQPCMLYSPVFVSNMWVLAQAGARTRRRAGGGRPSRGGTLLPAGCSGGPQPRLGSAHAYQQAAAGEGCGAGRGGPPRGAAFRPQLCTGGGAS